MYTVGRVSREQKVYRWTDGQTDRTDAEWHNIIRPFFKRAYKNLKMAITLKPLGLASRDNSLHVG